MHTLTAKSKRKTNQKKDISFVVDDDTFFWASKCNWGYQEIKTSTRSLYYFTCCINGRQQSLHRMILNATKSEVIDHIDGDTLNNLRANLRICSRSQNGANRSKPKESTSKYMGVSWDKQYSRWVAQITKNGRVSKIGRFDVEEEAGLAYNKMALKLHGDFARLNSI